MELEHDYGELGNRLGELCVEYPPDWNAIQSLISQVDINMTICDQYAPGTTLLSDIIREYFDFCHGEMQECLNCENKVCVLCALRGKSGAALPHITKMFLDYGFDVTACEGMVGAQCLDDLQYSSGDPYILDVAKLLLHAGADPHIRADLSEPPPVDALHNVGTESWFYLFEYKDAYTSDLLSTLFEIMDASEKGEAFDGIDSYESVIGKRLDQVLFCGNEKELEVIWSENNLGKKEYIFQDPMVLVCEGAHLCVDNSFALMVDPRIVQKNDKHFDASSIVGTCIGQIITNISLYPQGDPYRPEIFKEIAFANGAIIHIKSLGNPYLGMIQIEETDRKFAYTE